MTKEELELIAVNCVTDLEEKLAYSHLECLAKVRKLEKALRNFIKKCQSFADYRCISEEIKEGKQVLAKLEE